eukprot:COSAG01_NODE_25369_length_747_cov_1.163580_1_plen_55_part_01
MLPPVLQLQKAPAPGCTAKCKGDPSETCGAASVASFGAAVWAELYLGNVCSGQEI